MESHRCNRAEHLEHRASIRWVLDWVGIFLRSFIQSCNGHWLRQLIISDIRFILNRLIHLFRIPLDKIVWWTGNRNGQGISADHVHEIAREILQNRTSTQRDRHVDVIEVLEHMKAEIFEANKKKFEADPLLPKVSKEFKYVRS